MKLSRGIKHPRGIIVWDFDRVLFDTERQSIDNRKLLGEMGISEQMVLAVLTRMKRGKKFFSIKGFIKELNYKRRVFSVKKIRKIFHNNLVVNRYYDPKVDRLLHKLRNRGFVQMILSLGDAQFQRKKMFIGCGLSFRNHFVRICTTVRPKFLILAKIRKDNPGVRIIFVDDTKENLEQAKKNVSGIITIHYSNISGHSLKSLEEKIISYVRPA